MKWHRQRMTERNFHRWQPSLLCTSTILSLVTMVMMFFGVTHSLSTQRLFQWQSTTCKYWSPPVWTKKRWLNRITSYCHWGQRATCISRNSTVSIVDFNGKCVHTFPIKWQLMQFNYFIVCIPRARFAPLFGSVIFFRLLQIQIT